MDRIEEMLRKVNEEKDRLEEMLRLEKEER
jgi:hypothetical protein